VPTEEIEKVVQDTIRVCRMVDEAERQKNKDGKAKTSTPTPAL